MIRAFTTGLTLLAGLGTAMAANDLWEMPPLRYSEGKATDSIAQLIDELETNPKLLDANSSLDRLRLVLKRLEIPEASQILVFSKTSKQNELIHPGNPRSLFFNENAYVGYVPGGDIEVITHDPKLGPAFYMISNRSEPPTIARKTSACLSCHGTARTESVPGVLVRSVFTDEHGQTLLALGSHLTTHASPIPERWGGYYVTGTSSLPHMGNRTFKEGHDPTEVSIPPSYQTLEKIINTNRYPQPTSDIVALMVLEHQCQMQNLLTAASMNHRRYQWLRRSLHPDASPDDPDSREHIQHAATGVVDALLFNNEAPLGPDGISGSRDFQDAFTKRFPRSSDGRSLADFHLQKRIFKYPCSYMIYSSAFATLPEELRHEVLKQLKQALEAPPSPESHPAIPASTRGKILNILAETVADWPKN